MLKIKKYILIIVIALCIFQMLIMAAEITIGSEATDRAEAGMANLTTIDLNQAATGTGTIDTIKIWCNKNLTNCKVATFYLVSGNNYSTRDTVTIGAVTAGAERIITLDSESQPISLAVVEGDFLGIFSDADMERSGDGFSSAYYIGDAIPADNVEFTPYTKALSCGGTGTTEEEEGANIMFTFGSDF